MTVTGINNSYSGKAFEPPLTLSRSVTVQDIYCFSSQAETLTAGVYNSSNTLMKAVTLASIGAGWVSAAFPMTLTWGKYYLGRSGTGVNINLASGAGAGCFFDKSGNLPATFKQSGSFSSLDTPLYLTECRSLTIIGNLYGIGDSIPEGTGASSRKNRLLDLFTNWLNAHYGPVTLNNQGMSGVYSGEQNSNISNQLSGTRISVCVLETGPTNFILQA